MMRNARKGSLYNLRTTQPVHKLAHVRQGWHKTLCQEDINILSWMSRSPDLNPMARLWDVLGRRVRGHQHAPQTVRQLAIALQQEWDNIPRRTVRRLYCSVRSSECSQRAGGHPRYWRGSRFGWLLVCLWQYGQKIWRDRSHWFAGFKSHWIK